MMKKLKNWAGTVTNVTIVGIIVAVLIGTGIFRNKNAYQLTDYQVPGQNYQICNEQSQYLTSPWTYNALASGSQSYTVVQYEALQGYGTILPSLPSYISSESSTTEAAIIFAPGSSTNMPAYDFPTSPLIYFFEGGVYGPIDLQSVSGDEFIGGSATGFPEPTFNDGAAADGIDADNDSYDFSGGGSTLAASANIGAKTLTINSPISGYISWLTFADGSTYQISSASGDTIYLSTSLTTAENAGTNIWADRMQPIANVSAATAQGATTVNLSTSNIPLMLWDDVVIGADNYQIQTVAGSQANYTLTLSSGLDFSVGTDTPIYYNGPSGDVTVDYLNISDDLHNTTGTIYSGSGWMIEHDSINNSYSTPGYGVGLYGGNESTIEYNCFSKLGNYAANIFGNSTNFDYNEVYDTSYEPDPGCGCSGGGKWWGTLNTNIVDNAFVDTGIGSGQPAIWFDNGNTGMLVQGNYFYLDAGDAVDNETGFNMQVNDNLFLDDGWGNGQGQASNNDGVVNLNSSGGFNIPGSRYENQILIQSNYIINDWEGIVIWQAGARSCNNSGEGSPDAAYCSGGFPTTDTTVLGSQYYFSHQGTSANGGTTTVASSTTGPSSTITVNNPEAIGDQIGFSNPETTTTSNMTVVSTFTGSGIINATTMGFPSSGELRVDTSQAGGLSYTGAVLSYSGTTSSEFTGVDLLRGSGALTGNIQQVQPYAVTGETCYTNVCKLTVSPSISTVEAAGITVYNSGTCQLYATSSALPSGPDAPNGVSYWDGCQWQVRDVAVTGNTFIFQPSLMASNTPPIGSATSTVCSSSNYDNCGTNFMAYQVAGDAPFNSQISANALMSSSSFALCPTWDPGCTTDPLGNLNGLSNPPGAQANNGEAPGNNVWSDNTYNGPWTWTSYLYGTCSPLPTDTTTGKSMPSSACGLINFSQWQSDWQQDASSTYNPMVVSLSGLTAGQEIFGSVQSILAYEDTGTMGGITSNLQVNGSTISTLTSPPYNFSLNTLSYPDGSYTINVIGTDSGNNTNSGSISVYIANGDLNGDGKVNISDLSIMAAHWGKTDPAYSDGNVTGQSTINISDLAVLAANWGWNE